MSSRKLNALPTSLSCATSRLRVELTSMRRIVPKEQLTVMADAGGLEVSLETTDEQGAYGSITLFVGYECDAVAFLGATYRIP